MPGRDRDGRGVPPPYSSPWHLRHAAGSHHIAGDRTLPNPTLSLGRPTSPSSALQGLAIACRASLRSWLLPSRSSVGPCTASTTAKQPRDSATGVTAASALPPGVPAPGMLWSCCKHWELQESRARAAWQAVWWAAWQAAAPQPAELPSPRGRNREKSVLASAEKHTSLIWGI